MDWRSYWVILRTSIHERFMYRGDFAFGTLVRFLPLVTQVFLWGAIYRVGSSEPRGSMHGYTYEDMIAYYLLANVGRAFSSMPGLASGISREIREGTVKKYLTQPVDMLGYYFWSRMAHKMVYYIVATIPFAIVFYLCRRFFVQGWPAPEMIAGFVLSLLLAFLLGFLIESLIGLTSFWFYEVSSLIFVFMMVNYFLSGHMIPLDWLAARLPAWCAPVMYFQPFQYLSYFPARVMLGRYEAAELAWHLWAETAWVLLFFALNRYTFHRGVRHYSAFGG